MRTMLAGAIALALLAAASPPNEPQHQHDVIESSTTHTDGIVPLELAAVNVDGATVRAEPLFATADGLRASDLEHDTSPEVLAVAHGRCDDAEPVEILELRSPVEHRRLRLPLIASNQVNARRAFAHLPEVHDVGKIARG